jgi:hypothetical protein
MTVDWRAFGEVFVVSFGAAIGVIVLFAIGVSLLSRAPAAVRSDTDPGGDLDSGSDVASSTPVAQLAAGLCFLACALTVSYGLYLIVSK